MPRSISRLTQDRPPFRRTSTGITHIRYSLFVIRYSLFVIRYSLFVIRYSLFVKKLWFWMNENQIRNQP
ncbi:hypothetical protein CR161_03235 [Prosthecochloris sp. ZM]|nr:hypothetical protein CR161_03235 [Prosthecochloris sp. ZM]